MALPTALVAGFVAGSILAGARLWRVRHDARAEAAALARRPLGPDGIMGGAHDIVLRRHDAPGVLLLHGAGDTPHSLRYLARHLHERGYGVRAPLLPGHGRSIQEFGRATAGAWHAAARRELAELRRDHRWVAVIGLSMGGALAARLAGEEDAASDVDALILLAPYLTAPLYVRCGAAASPVWGQFTSYIDTLDPRSIHDEAERGHTLGHGLMTPAALRALVMTARAGRLALARIVAPTLIIQSRHDNRVTAPSAERAYRQLGSARKRLVWRDVGGHILTVDHGRDEVLDEIVTWLGEHGGLR